MLSKKQLNNFVSIEDFIYIFIVCLFVFLFPYQILKADSLGCVLSAGGYLLDNFTLLTKNIFTFTSINDYWVNTNWLSDIILTLCYRLGNYTLIAILVACIVGISFTAVYRQMSAKYNNVPLNLILLTIGIIASSNSLEATSRIFSLPIILAFIFLLEKITEKGLQKSYVIYLVLLNILWVNLNTDFLFGFIIVLIYLITSLIQYATTKNKALITTSKHLIIVLSLLIITTLINPYTYNLPVLIVKFIGSGLYNYSGFLSSPNFHQSYPVSFYELFILILLFLSLFSTYKPPIKKLLTVLIFLLFSLYSVVNIPFFIILALPLISDVIGKTNISFNILLLKNFLDKTTLSIAPVTIVLSILFTIILFMLSIALPEKIQVSVKFESMPVKAVKYLKKNNIKGNIFNPLGWGCFLHNQLGCKVFITELLYQPDLELLDDYNKIINIYNVYQDRLEKNKVDIIIIPNHHPLELLLQENKQWKKIYQDEKSCLYKKLTPVTSKNKP